MANEDYPRSLQLLLKTELFNLARMLDLEGVKVRATKAEIVEWLCTRHPEDVLNKVPRGRIVPMANALGILSTGTKTQLIDRLFARFCDNGDVADGGGSLLLAADMFRAFNRDFLYEFATRRFGDAQVGPRWSATRITDWLARKDCSEVLCKMLLDELRILADSIGVTRGGRKVVLRNRLAARYGIMPVNPVPVLMDDDGFGRKVKVLIIGNQSYPMPDSLENPIKDSEDTGVMLAGLGYEVVVVNDVTLGAMRTRIREFARGLQPDEGVMFFYSGHGIEYNGRNWLLPIDYDGQRPEELDDSALALDEIQRLFRRQRFRVLVLDCCRASGFRARMRGIGAWEDAGRNVALEAPGTEGTLICFATSPGQVASDGQPGTNGIYTAAILEEFPVPGRTIEQIMRAVRRAVSDATGNRQVPWDHSCLTGDWYPAGR